MLQVETLMLVILILVWYKVHLGLSGAVVVRCWKKVIIYHTLANHIWENTLSYLFWIIIYDWTLWLSTKKSINTMFPETVNKSWIMWIVALFCFKTLMSRLAEKVKSAQYAICCGNFPINCTVKHICQSRDVNGKSHQIICTCSICHMSTVQLKLFQASLVVEIVHFVIVCWFCLWPWFRLFWWCKW